MTQPFSIGRPVGERETNRSDDLEAVRNALAARGLCQRSVTGQRNAKFKPDLTAGIRIFQRKAGLEPDGLVIPGGPTAMALGLGGAPATSAPAESRLADDATLHAIEQDIAEARRELRGTSILAEEKQTVDAATCADWRNQVATAGNNIAELNRRIPNQENAVKAARDRLEAAEAQLRAYKDARDNLRAVIREINADIDEFCRFA